MSFLWRVNFVLLLFSSQAYASFPTYKGLEMSGAECTVSVINQYDSSLEVLVTITKNREMIYLETLTLQTTLHPQFRTRDYDRSSIIDTTYDLEFTRIYYQHSNIRYLDSKKTEMAFRQWQSMETSGPKVPKSVTRIFNYSCASLRLTK